MQNNKLVWIDLEMSGLNPETDKILEIATIVTDDNLNVCAQGPVYAIHQSNAIIENMDEWNTLHHNRSGLVEKVRNSRISEQIASENTIAFLQQHLDPGTSPLCGNSIGQDRMFLRRYMPKLNEYFHYRNIDVSTLKELAKRWNPKIISKNNKCSAHTALEDIKESIIELRLYKKYFCITTKDH
jgi:oligoribonuclease